MLDPASSAAASVNALTIALTIAATLLLAGVIALALIGTLRRPTPVSGTRWIIAGGIALPVVVLTVLLIAALLIGDALVRAAPAPVARIRVDAKQWWWEVRYLPPPSRAASALAAMLESICGPLPLLRAGAGAREETPIVLANELRIPVGSAVLLELSTDDVIHSFWVPGLAGKVDMIPGRVNRLVLQPERAGIFRGQCAEYCGGPHGWMAFEVVAVTDGEYQDWLTKQAEPAAAPTDAVLKLGQAAFFSSGCARCHAIRGTDARGTLGPDLTHVASRRKIAAGTLDNHVGTLAGWIADPQTIKPGNRMPPTTTLAGEQLRALAAYMASLH